MAKFVGKWKCESSNNFDEYMKAVGVGLVTRTTASALKPDVIISQTGDKWKLRTESTFKTTEIEFTLGVEFDETTGDGRKVKSTMAMEGDTKLIQSQKGSPDSVLTRELTDDSTMILTCEAKGVKCTRTYKRA